MGTDLWVHLQCAVFQLFSVAAVVNVQVLIELNEKVFFLIVIFFVAFQTQKLPLSSAVTRAECHRMKKMPLRKESICFSVTKALFFGGRETNVHSLRRKI